MDLASWLPQALLIYLWPLRLFPWPVTVGIWVNLEAPLPTTSLPPAPLAGGSPCEEELGFFWWGSPDLAY